MDYSRANNSDFELVLANHLERCGAYNNKFYYRMRISYLQGESLDSLESGGGAQSVGIKELLETQNFRFIKLRRLRLIKIDVKLKI